ncbi:MAG: hypothetical protein M3443_08390 [Actinomycetota bacterium]|nr:hypothetical protein [Actinomycetota bacterium]
MAPELPALELPALAARVPVGLARVGPVPVDLAVPEPTVLGAVALPVPVLITPAGLVDPAPMDLADLDQVGRADRVDPDLAAREGLVTPGPAVRPRSRREPGWRPAGATGARALVRCR